MRLDEICTEIVDCEHKTAPLTGGGGFYAVGTPAMAGNIIDYSLAREISEETFHYWTKRMTPIRGDLLFAREAPVGPVVAIPPELNVAPGQRTVLLRPDPHIADSRYLYFRLTSPSVQRRIHDLSMGSTVAHLNVSDVRALHLPLPPLPEQQAIAEILGALDDKIAANRALVATSAALRDASVQKITDNSLPKLILSKLAVVLTRGGAPKYTESDDSFLVINQKCVRDGKVQLNDARRTSVPPTPDRTLRFGDVLVNSTGTGTLGRVGIWTHPEHATTDSHVSIVRLPQDNFPLCRAQQLVQAERFIASLGEGSTGQTELSRAILGTVELSELHRSQAAGAEALMHNALVLEQSKSAEAEHLASLRDTLLPAVMDGTIRIKDAGNAAEEVL